MCMYRQLDYLDNKPYICKHLTRVQTTKMSRLDWAHPFQLTEIQKHNVRVTDSIAHSIPSKTSSLRWVLAIKVCVVWHLARHHPVVAYKYTKHVHTHIDLLKCTSITLFSLCRAQQKSILTLVAVTLFSLCRANWMYYFHVDVVCSAREITVCCALHNKLPFLDGSLAELYTFQWTVNIVLRAITDCWEWTKHHVVSIVLSLYLVFYRVQVQFIRTVCCALHNKRLCLNVPYL